MRYFSYLIPKITSQNDTYFDLFYNIIITDVIKDEFLINYDLKDGESLKDVSYNFYNDTTLWWLLAIINNIKDPFFDIAKSNEYIQQCAIENATNLPVFWPENDEGLFWEQPDQSQFWYNQLDFIEQYDILTEYNESIRTIKVLNPRYKSQVIAKLMEKINE